jgi:hypothetical protein
LLSRLVDVRQRAELHGVRRRRQLLGVPLLMTEYLVTAETVLLMLIALLVVGLLRSHASILTQLTALTREQPDAGEAIAHEPHGPPEAVAPGVVAAPPGVDLEDAPAVPAVRGVTLELAETVLPLADGRHTLLAFLGTGCLTCEELWDALLPASSLELPGSIDLVVVTKNRDEESLSKLRKLKPPNVPVIMSSETWRHCRVPGTPYFALVDGSTKRLIGAGSAQRWDQVLSLVGDTLDELELVRVAEEDGNRHGRRRSKIEVEDEALTAAGISQGHPSLLEPLHANTGTDGHAEAALDA